MQLTKTQKIIISLLTVLVMFGLYIFFDKRSRNQETNSGGVSISTTTTTSITTNPNPVGVQGLVEQTNKENKIAPRPIPDLNRSIVVYPGVSVSPEVTALALGKIKEFQAKLKTDFFYIRAWVNLGVYQKMAGDYDGTLISWKYILRLNPADFISLANIGNLYAYFLHDNAQAEIYYKEAIKHGPTQAYIYVQLAEVYRDIFKDLDKARAIIDQGLSQIPNDPSLLQFKASLSN